MFISPWRISKSAFIAGALLFTPMWSAHALAQNEGSLEGTVVDGRTMQPIAGAVISVTGQDSTVVTSADGSFSFEVLRVGIVHLRVQREGYSSTVEEVEVVPGGGTFLQVSIMQIAAFLDDLLVRVPPRRSLADLDAVEGGDSDSGGTAADLLAQRLPGVQVHRGTGAIGGGVEVRIRGVSSVTGAREPAIYLDGLRLNPSAPTGLSLRSQPALLILDEIPASQIKSIRVLRGPSASAAYGDAADGVILIETRRGGADEPN